MNLAKTLLIIVGLSLVACGTAGQPPPSRGDGLPPAPLGSAPAAMNVTTIAPTHVAVQAEAVAEIARAGLPTWLRGIGADYAGYGFKGADELALATVGMPYEVYALAPQAVQRYQPGQRVSELITPLNTWELPVLVRGEGRAILTVAFHEGRWQVVQFGGGNPAFSQSLIDVGKQFVGVAGAIKLLVVHQIHSTFALIEQDGQEYLIFLNPAGFFKSLDVRALTPYAPEALMPEIAQAYAEQASGGG